MHKPTFAAGMIAMSCAVSPGASAQTCPKGQIYRVSMQVCQPKSSENAHWLKQQGDAKQVLKPSAAKPAVGDLVLFGATLPTLLKPSVSKPVAKAPVRKRAVATARAPKPAVSKPPAAKRALPAVAAIPAAGPNFDDAKKVAETQQLASPAPETLAAPASPPPGAVPETPAERPVASVKEPAQTAEPPRPAPADVADAFPDKSAAAPNASNEARSADEGAAVRKSDQQIAALENTGDDRLPSNEPALTPPQRVETPFKSQVAPPASPEPPPQTSTSAVESTKQVRTIPLYHRPEPSPSAGAKSELPDWGDEKKLVEALRADWKAAPVSRTFQRGDEVPADIPLQPLPPAFASRDRGVNMHYFMSNGDAVLVLPIMRVVVDVYHSSTASLR